MVGDTLNPGICIEVLVQSKLENGRSSIPGNNNRVGQEEDPDTVPPVAVFLDNLVLVADPVLIPSVDGSRVVNSKNINVLDLESSSFDLRDNPAKRA